MCFLLFQIVALGKLGEWKFGGVISRFILFNALKKERMAKSLQSP